MRIQTLAPLIAVLTLAVACFDSTQSSPADSDSDTASDGDTLTDTDVVSDDDTATDNDPATDTDIPALPDVLGRTEVQASHPDCPGEATVFTSGLDEDADGHLDDSEVSVTLVVCAHDEECDVQESATEVTVTCPEHPPVNIAKPATPGYLVVVEDAAWPSPCPRGGVVVRAGLDNGPGAGEAGNGSLEASEVEDTWTLCSAYCGDGNVDEALGEACDDNDGGCSDACELLPVCDDEEPDPSCPTFAYHVASIQPATMPTSGGTMVFTGTFPLSTSVGNASVSLEGHGDLQITSASATQISFIAPPGVGEPVLSLTVGEVPVPFWVPARSRFNGSLELDPRPTSKLLYQAPVVTAVHGCNDGGNATTDCPRAGGVTLTVSGMNFGPAEANPAVHVDGQPCTSVTSLTPHTTLQCVLPAATNLNYDRSVTVTVGGKSSGSNSLLSYAGPAITPNTLRLVGGTSTNHLLMPSTNAHVIEFTATGIGNNAAQLSVDFGDDRTRFACTNISLPSPGLVRCTTADAVGKDLRLRVTSPSGESRSSSDRLSYPPPSIVGGDGVVGTRSLGETLTFQAFNIHPNPALLNVTLGEYGCDILSLTDPVTAPDQPTIWTVTCRTGLGTGGPHPVVLHALGQASAEGPLTFTYPAGPTIIYATGCPTVRTGAPHDCPTRGQVRLTITGGGFTATTTVTVGGLPCTSIQLLSTVRLTCVLPPGVGEKAIIAYDNGIQSLPLPLFYAAPRITRITGCIDVGPTTTECPSSGGVTITIEGQEFGPSGAIVFVGGRYCTDVVHDSLRPHQQLTCTLPRGAGPEQPVVMSNGLTSTSAFYLGYQTPSAP